MPIATTTTYLLHCFIAGLQYYDVLEIWKSLKIGDRLDLIPEPDNRHDHNAVMVTYKGKQLGYQIIKAGIKRITTRRKSIKQRKNAYYKS